MISIITALYKSERYLPKFNNQVEAFADELQRAGVEFELVVIPTQPSAEERQVIDRLKKNSWVRVYPLERRGLYAAWNEGVARARGNVLGFWNVDDIRYSKALVDGSTLIAKGAELVYFPFKIKRYLRFFGLDLLVHSQTIDRQVPEYRVENRPRFYHEMHCGPFFVFTKNLYEKVGPFDEQFKIAGDFDWCARAARVSERLVKSKTIAGEFRVDGRGLSAGWSVGQRVENNIVYERQGFVNKIVPVDAVIASKYNAGIIQIGQKQIPYSVF